MMMLTELSGIASIIDCTESMVTVAIIGFVFGCLIGAGLYHFLKNSDGN